MMSQRGGNLPDEKGALTLGAPGAKAKVKRRVSMARVTTDCKKQMHSQKAEVQN